MTCHETRSLALNRRLARRHLLEKACLYLGHLIRSFRLTGKLQQLDKIQNPGLSKEELGRAKQRERERRRRKKAKKKSESKGQNVATASEGER